MKRVLLEMDLAGAEWVIVAYISGDERMIAVCESGESPHVATARFMFGAEPAYIKQEERDLEGCSDAKKLLAYRKEHAPSLLDGRALPPNKTLRQGGKNSNHSLNYGLGYKEYALRYGIEEKHAKPLRELYHEKAYPDIHKSFWTYVQHEIRQHGCLVNCFGHRRDFYSVPSAELWLDAYAHLPQSTVMGLTRMGMVHVYQNEPDAELRMQIHDSIVYSVPGDAEYISSFVSRATEIMTQPMTYRGRTFSLGLDSKIGLTKNKRHMIKVTGSLDVCRAALEAIENGNKAPA